MEWILIIKITLQFINCIDAVWPISLRRYVPDMSTANDCTKNSGTIKCGRSLSTKCNQRRVVRLPCLQPLHFTIIKAREHCSTEYFYILFAKLFVWTFGNSVQCEQYFVQSVLQEFLRTTSFLYSAALCRWNHGNGLEEYRLTLKQFIDLCAVLSLLLWIYIPANMEKERRPYYGSRCIRLTARWLALTLRATQQLTSVLPRASWSSCWLQMTALSVCGWLAGCQDQVGTHTNVVHRHHLDFGVEIQGQGV